MSIRRNSLVQHPIVRGVGALGGSLAIIFVIGDIPQRTAVPVTILFAGIIAHSVADERWNLPRGSTNCAFGVLALLAGAYWLVVRGSTTSALAVTVAGSWFVFDGVTIVRHGRNGASDGSTGEAPNGHGEAILRLQTRTQAKRTLETAPEPRTAVALAAELDLTESRVRDALEYLQEAGYVESVEDGYRASPSRWGRLDPIARVVVWVPKRIVRPFRRF